MTLTEFLLARIAEDEAAAHAASPAPWTYEDVDSVAGGSLYDKDRMIGDLHYEQVGDHDGRIVRHLLSDEADRNGEHIARHDPARVLAECQAKRHLVELFVSADEHAKRHADVPMLGLTAGAYESALRVLALPYADHPDFREEWKP